MFAAAAAATQAASVATSPAMVALCTAAALCIAAIVVLIALTVSLRPTSGTPLARTSQSACDSRSRWQPVRRTLTCPPSLGSCWAAAGESKAQATSVETQHRVDKNPCGGGDSSVSEARCVSEGIRMHFEVVGLGGVGCGAYLWA